MERVVRQVQQTQQVLQKADAEWSDISTALDELAHAIESLGPHHPMRDVSRQLLSISSELGAQIVGFRSKLVGDVCAHIARIVKVMLRDFRDVANALLPSLANTAKGASGAVRQPGAKLFSVISEHVRYDLQMLQGIFVRAPQGWSLRLYRGRIRDFAMRLANVSDRLFASSEKVRLLLLEQIALVLSCWRKEEIAPYYNDILDVIQRGLLDSPQQVRSLSRGVFCSFSAQWEERITELVDVPSAPSRDLLLKEKPHAAISLAIVKKYPELQKKLSRVDSSKAIAKQRSLYKKSSLVETQEVKILVATPPEKKRLEQAKDTSRSPPPFQRQLFQDNENEQQPRPRKSGLRPPSASKIDQLQSSSSRLTQPSSTGIPVPPASTRPEDAFRRSSRIEMKAEGSKIPPPPTKSPVTRARSVTRPAVTSHSQDTAALESKRLTSLRRPQEGISSSMDSFKNDLKAYELAKQPSTSNLRDQPQASSARVELPASKPSDELLISSTPKELPTFKTQASFPVDESPTFTIRDEPPVSNFCDEPDSTLRIERLVNDEQPAVSLCDEPLASNLYDDQSSFKLRDDFLNHPIPSSATSPTPRSDANITVRARRPRIHVVESDATPVPIIESSTQLPQDDPVPPIFSLDDEELISQEKPQQAVEAKMAQVTLQVAEEVNPDDKPTGGVLCGTTSVFEATVVPSNDTDIEETMLISPNQMQQDCTKEAVEVREQASVNNSNFLDQTALQEVVEVREQVGLNDCDFFDPVCFQDKTDAHGQVQAATDFEEFLKNEIVEQVPVVQQRDHAEEVGEARGQAPSSDDSVLDQVYMEGARGVRERVNIDFEQAERNEGVEQKTTTQGRAAIDLDKPNPKSLPKDALENLKGIQEKMAALLTLAKVEARGIPLKQPANKMIEPPPPRPLLSDDQIFSTAEVQEKDYSIAADALFPSAETESQSFAVAEEFEFSYQVHDPSVDRNDGKDLKRDFVEDHESRRLARPSEQRRASEAAHRNPSLVRDKMLQQEYPSRRPRAVKQSIADAERAEVERHFNEIVREGLINKSRPAPAEENEKKPERRRNAMAQPSLDSVKSVTQSGRSSGPLHSMEQPLQWNMKPADRVSQRLSPVHELDDNCGGENAERNSGDAGGRAMRAPSGSVRAAPEAKRSWTLSLVGYFCLLLGFIFGASGLLRAAITMRDSHEYHQALLTRISRFESSISESYTAVRKLEENYAVWSEYIRMLAEEDEVHTLSLLETIQHEVEKWQVEMREDLTQFKKSLSVDVVEAALAPLLRNATEQHDE